MGHSLVGEKKLNRKGSDFHHVYYNLHIRFCSLIHSDNYSYCLKLINYCAIFLELLFYVILT